MTKDTEAVFLAALEMGSPEARKAYAVGACADNPEMLEHVQQLLDAHAELKGPLDSPPAAVQSDVTLHHEISEKPGAQIGPFKLLQELGRGGMGIVYMAEQAEPVARRVALKIIKPGMDTGQVIARFEVERQALAMMDHPHIAKVLDAGATDSGRPYFVMELVKGIPVTQYCDEQHLSPKQRLELFVKVCQAVQHAHQKGIIHRDLKPTNILVAEYDQQAVPKIIDFGVVKATNQKLTEKTTFTQFGQIMGTLEYMSPEQAKLNQLDIDTRSDVYSLGVLLYELLTGDTPFDRKRLHSAAFEEMLRIIREEEPPKPSTRLSGSNDRLTIAKRRAETPDRLDKVVKGDLDWIAMKALEKDRARRYETAASFAADIERFLADQAIEARPPSRLYLMRKFVRRHRGPVLAASTILLLLLAGIIGTVHQWRRAESEAVKARSEADKAVAAADRANAANQNALQIIWQDALAFAMSNEVELAEIYRERARQVNATGAQLAMLDAVIAIGRNDIQGFIDRSQQVIDEDPTNISMRAWRSVHHAARGELAQTAFYANEALALTPEAPEDYALLGLLLMFTDPAEGVRLVDRALSQQESGLARAIRAKLLSYRALHGGNFEDALEALTDARRARLFLGNVSLAALATLRAADSAYYLGKRRGVAAAKLEELAREADEAAEILIRDDVLGVALIPIEAAHHYEIVRKDMHRAELAWQRVEQADPGHLCSFYAAFKLRHEGRESAIAVHRHVDGDGGLIASVSKGILLALSNDSNERAQAAELFSVLEGMEGFPICCPDAAIIPILLGDIETARRVLSRTRDRDPNFRRFDSPPTRAFCDFLLGTIDAPQFVEQPMSARQQSCAWYYIGLKAIADGDWDFAKQSFGESVNAIWPFLQYHHQWSSAMLDEMERNPQWMVVRSAN